MLDVRADNAQIRQTIATRENYHKFIKGYKAAHEQDVLARLNANAVQRQRSRDLQLAIVKSPVRKRSASGALDRYLTAHRQPIIIDQGLSPGLAERLRNPRRDISITQIDSPDRPLYYSRPDPDLYVGYDRPPRYFGSDSISTVRSEDLQLLALDNALDDLVSQAESSNASNLLQEFAAQRKLARRVRNSSNAAQRRAAFMNSPRRLTSMLRNPSRLERILRPRIAGQTPLRRNTAPSGENSQSPFMVSPPTRRASRSIGSFYTANGSLPSSANSSYNTARSRSTKQSATSTKHRALSKRFQKWARTPIPAIQQAFLRERFSQLQQANVGFGLGRTPSRSPSRRSVQAPTPRIRNTRPLPPPSPVSIRRLFGPAAVTRRSSPGNAPVVVTRQRSRSVQLPLNVGNRPRLQFTTPAIKNAVANMPTGIRRQLVRYARPYKSIVSFQPALRKQFNYNRYYRAPGFSSRKRRRVY